MEAVRPKLHLPCGKGAADNSMLASELTATGALAIAQGYRMSRLI